MIEFLIKLADEIEDDPDLTPEATEEIPDALVPEEHARMLRNVAAVFLESRNQKEPFRSWRE
jgi:hypothetical protein